jgi:hypothetical protein
MYPEVSFFGGPSVHVEAPSLATLCLTAWASPFAVCSDCGVEGRTTIEGALQASRADPALGSGAI